MKKFSKVLITAIAAVSLVVSLAACNNQTAATTTTAAASEALYVTSVEYGAKYIETAATDDDTINSPSASSNIVKVTLSDGSEVSAEGDGVLTLVREGDQYDIIDAMNNQLELVAGNYSFETTAGGTEYSEMAKFMNMAGNTAQYTYRQALKVDGSGVVANETIPSLLTKVESYDGSKIANGELNSYGAFFNGIVVDSAKYSIEGVKIVGNGDGANDFQGEAAMVLAAGSADVTVKDSAIFSQGVIRTAAAVKENGILRLDNALIYTEETADTQAEYDALVVPMMKRTPFALGLEGVVRATNVLGSGQGIYTDSLIVSSGWGVLSTDSGSAYDQVKTYALDVSNTVAGTGTVEVAESGKDYFATKTINGVEYGYIAGGSGYVAYADSGVWDKFDNVKFYGGNEVQIMASNKSSAFYTNSELTSAHIGVMTQQNAGGTISIKDSTLNVGETGIQIKSGAANDGYTNIEIDNTKINFTSDAKWGGTLIELVESDDAGNPGNTSFTVNDTGDEATINTPTASVADTTATLSNGEYTGNIWNNIYNKYQKLVLTIDNATVNGTISSSYSYHLTDDGKRMENGTELQADTTGNYLESGVTDYNKIGAQYNVANEQIANPIDVTLTNNSTWNVVLADGTNGEAKELYINNLTVEAGSTVKADKAVTIHVYGTADIQGTLDANITIVQEEYTEPSCTTNTFSLVDMADPRHTATFIVTDEEGNEVIGGVNVANYKAFVPSYFTLGFNGYELVSMTVVDGDGTITELKEGDEYFGEYDYSLAMNSDITVSVVVKAAQSEGGMGGEGGGMGGDPGAGGGDMGGDPGAGGGDMGGTDPNAGGSQGGTDPNAGGSQGGTDPNAGGDQSGDSSQVPDGAANPPDGEPPDGYGGGSMGDPPAN